ncbi:hypothetical protein ACSAZK_00600 [Methanosarcina sp. Mfa9]|uniref:hypothetical protein n=1 Tax=Methanosarcina sp. Mfa9 TaxID=3439063 RepID=UPI003F85BC71
MELKPEEKYRAVISPDIFPTAEPEYTYSTFAVVRAPYGPKLLNSPEKTHKGSKLNLTAPDFPLNYVWVEASRRLLDIAELHGTCTWLEAGLEIRQPFDFDFEASKEEEEEEKGEEEEKTCKLAIAVPREREGKKQEEIPLIEIRALSRTDEKMLCLARRGKKLCLDLPSFPEYGPQKLEIRCIFEPGAKFCVIELLPEGKEPCRKYISVRHFTPSSPLQEWTWFADSPFRGGYRFRKKVFDKEPGPWLNPLNPSVPLLIRVKAGEEREEPEQQGTKTSRTRIGPGTRGSEKS